MKLLKKYTAILTCAILLVSVVIGFNVVKAASFGISASSGTVAPGGTFAVYLSGDCIGRVNLSVSNGSLSTSSVWFENGRAESAISVTAGGSGSVTVTATPEAGFSDANGAEANIGARSTTVSIVRNNTGGGNNGGNTGGNAGNANANNPTPEEDNKSKDNNLSELTISEGTLDPGFDANTTSYKVNLAANVKKISINAKAADAKASVTGVGEKELVAGENRIAITVTAENGAAKEYVILAVVDEKPEVYLNYTDLKLGVVRNTRDIVAPAGFEEITLKYKKSEIKAWKNNAMKCTIVYLIDEKTSEKNFYIFDEKTQKITTVMKPTAILGNNVFIVDIPKEEQEIEGFKYTKVKVDDKELMGWTFEDKKLSNYTLIKVMNDQGEMKFFQHEKTQNTLQLYSGSVPTTQEVYDKVISESQTYKMISVVAGSLVVLLGVATVLLLISHKKKITRTK